MSVLGYQGIRSKGGGRRDPPHPLKREGTEKVLTFQCPHNSPTPFSLSLPPSCLSLPPSCPIQVHLNNKTRSSVSQTILCLWLPKLHHEKRRRLELAILLTQNQNVFCNIRVPTTQSIQQGRSPLPLRGCRSLQYKSCRPAQWQSHISTEGICRSYSCTFSTLGISHASMPSPLT